MGKIPAISQIKGLDQGCGWDGKAIYSGNSRRESRILLHSLIDGSSATF
jgi:hypothetical protein